MFVVFSSFGKAILLPLEKSEILEPIHLKNKHDAFYKFQLVSKKAYLLKSTFFTCISKSQLAPAYENSSSIIKGN